MTNEDRAGRFMKGHIWSVAAASWTFAASKAASVQFGRAVSASDQLLDQFFQLALVMCSIFAIVWFVTLIAAFVPTLLTWWLARQFSISSVWYFVAAGALTGAILSPIIVILIPGGVWGPAPDPTFYQTVTSFLLFMVPSGAIGGLVFWRVVGRFIRKAASMAASA